MSFGIVNSRTISGLPLSVGTSLAMESVFDPVLEPIDASRKIPQRIDLDNYEEVWINIGTLFRNLYTSLERSQVGLVSGQEAASGIASEMEIITDLVSNKTNGRTECVFYHCSYEDLSRIFKLGTLRLPRTDKQFMYSNLYTKTMKILIDQGVKGASREIEQYKTKIHSKSRLDALFFTHFPVDLLNDRYFGSIDLLESHTGLLKKKNEWYTKYFDGRDLNMLPFSAILLPVFGDDHHFRPQSRAMKEAVFLLAKEKRWNCLTNDSKITTDIRTMKDHALRDALLVQAG